MGRFPARPRSPGPEAGADIHSEHLGLAPHGSPCCYCGRTLRGGNDADTVTVRMPVGVIYMHRACALALADRLLRESGRGER